MLIGCLHIPCKAAFFLFMKIQVVHPDPLGILNAGHRNFSVISTCCLMLCLIHLRVELLLSTLPWPINLYDCLKNRALHRRVWVHYSSILARVWDLMYATQIQSKQSAVMWAGCVYICTHAHNICQHQYKSVEGGMGGSECTGSLFQQSEWIMSLSLGLSYSTSVPAFLSEYWAQKERLINTQTHTNKQGDTKVKHLVVKGFATNLLSFQAELL